ncbi:hypothetical protein B296_00046039 [Ensete ventricosum]|uniref:Uncharacterized protein n=1 Tax=Ensete ventricosum TaxID=4639 RepID=A0A426Z5A9_ENSVE|nr:hypothetical protein B296_00046039 [Ensete ventricosum]
MPNLAQLRWAPPNPFSPYTTTRFPHPLLFRSCNLVPILDAFGRAAADLLASVRVQLIRHSCQETLIILLFHLYFRCHFRFF